ncbi:MAG TPA: alanine racemase [Sphingopyxis sp.]|nr:alanine racemase [Sphingopyxis sp.]
MEPPAPPHSSRLIVDCDAIAANFQFLATRVAPAECGAVIKADAYGLGIADVAPALLHAGCRSFFVARLCEAERLRRLVGSGCNITILNGLDPGSEAACAVAGFVPVLNSVSQFAAWRAHARSAARPLPAALQIDTGMSRLGLSPDAALAAANDPELAEELDLKLLMTHLACGDEPVRSVSMEQLNLFEAVAAHFPAVPRSIANSAAAFLPRAFHCDVVRTGVALFGVSPLPEAMNLQPAVRLDARILQIRAIEAGTGVGYGLDHVATTSQRLATIAIGYADGWPRSLGGKGAAWHQGVRLPIVGRISMDSLTIDIGGLADGSVSEGDFVELLGPSQTLADVARDAGTIAYEILTGLGARHARFAIENGQTQAAHTGATA